MKAAIPLLETVPSAHTCLADTAYDADELREFLAKRGTRAVIPNNPRRKNVQPFDADLYRDRNVIERTMGRLKDWRRIATRYDALSANYASAVALACALIWWC